MSAMLRSVGEALSPIVDLVYPPRCPNCGDAIGEQGGLCIECWISLVIPGDPACSKCQRPFGEARVDAASICAPCMVKPPIHDGIAAATLYSETSRKLVLVFKHGRKIALAQMLARLMAARLPEFEDTPLLVPVPLHRSRLWQRGYNQAALLARELERLGKGELLVDGLIRRKATPPLGGLGAKARVRTLSGAIVIRRGLAEHIVGRKVILVDDVLTSGATSEACVRALKKAGARRVIIACFARVLDEAKGGKVSPNETPETTKVPGAT